MSSIVEKFDAVTPEQFLAHPGRDRFELICGRLVEGIVPGLAVILSAILPPKNIEQVL